MTLTGWSRAGYGLLVPHNKFLRRTRNEAHLGGGCWVDVSDINVKYKLSTERIFLSTSMCGAI